MWGKKEPQKPLKLEPIPDAEKFLLNAKLAAGMTTGAAAGAGLASAGGMAGNFLIANAGLGAAGSFHAAHGAFMVASSTILAPVYGAAGAVAGAYIVYRFIQTSRATKAAKAEKEKAES